MGMARGKGRDIIFMFFPLYPGGVGFKHFWAGCPRLIGLSTYTGYRNGKTMQERITSTKMGLSLLFRAVYVCLRMTLRTLLRLLRLRLDATTVLGRKVSEKFTAVDPLDSNSRILSAEVLGDAHYNARSA